MLTIFMYLYRVASIPFGLPGRQDLVELFLKYRADIDMATKVSYEFKHYGHLVVKYQNY